MPDPKALTPAASEALAGPFAVEYHDNWPDHYHVSGQVPGEDDEENTVDDERGRHDVRRRAIELLPEMVSLLALARSLMIDADDRGELDWDDETSIAAQKLLDGTGEVLDSINAAAAPHELEPLDVPPERFRAWLIEVGIHPVGMPDSPTLNPVALFLEETHGRPIRVENCIVRLPDGTKRRTLPYMDGFLWVVGRVFGGPIRGGDAVRFLDGVLSGAYELDGQAKLPLSSS